MFMVGKTLRLAPTLQKHMVHKGLNQTPAAHDTTQWATPAAEYMSTVLQQPISSLACYSQVVTC